VPGKAEPARTHRRRRRDDGVERTARDGDVPVEGGSDDRQRVWRGPAARGEQGCEEMAVDGGD
jgi:hypothetical protein